MDHTPVQNHSGADLFSEQTELDRRLGLTEALSIVFGRIIGSGIFRTPGPILLLTASVGLFYGVWIVGGLVTLLSAFCYAELVAMMPKSGGPYAYLKAAYPPVWTFLRGWAMFFVSETGAIAAVALVFAEYFHAFYFSAFGVHLARVYEIGLALAAIWLLTLVNCFGIALSGKVQNLFSSVKFIALLVIVAVCFSRNGNPAHLTMELWPDKMDFSAMLAFGAAMRYGFFAYSGWEGATYVAEEVKQPRKNLPLSIILGISGIILLYLAVNTAYLLQLTPEMVRHSRWVATDAMRNALGVSGGVFIAFAVMINTFGNISTQVLCKARTWYAMARDGLFIKALSRLDARYKTPNRALLVQGAWATVLLLAAALAGHAYEAIIDFFSFTSAVFNISTFTAIWVLRRKYPDAPRPFRVPWYPYTLILVVLIHIWFMAVTVISAPIPSLLGVLLTCTGLVYYYRGRLFRGFH